MVQSELASVLGDNFGNNLLTDHLGDSHGITVSLVTLLVAV